MSWDETGSVWDKDGKRFVEETARAVALCDGTWFMAAINTLRDGDMGRKDESGVYERIWWGDDIFNADVVDGSLRPANRREVDLYLSYCPIEAEAKEDESEIVAVIYGADRTDVIFKKK